MIAAYMRVSTDKQDERMQEDELKRILPKEKETTWYVDHGITGTKNSYTNREQYAAMLEDAKAGKIERIYCYDWSRMWRNMAEQSRAMEALLSYGVPLTSVREGNYEREEDNFILHIQGAVNEREAMQTRHKSRDGINSKHKKVAEAMFRATQSGMDYDDIPKEMRWDSPGRNWKKDRA